MKGKRKRKRRNKEKNIIKLLKIRRNFKSRENLKVVLNAFLF